MRKGIHEDGAGEEDGRGRSKMGRMLWRFGVVVTVGLLVWQRPSRFRVGTQKKAQPPSFSTLPQKYIKRGREIGIAFNRLPENPGRRDHSVKSIYENHQTRMSLQAAHTKRNDEFERRYRTFLVLSGYMSDPLKIAKLARKVRKREEAMERAKQMMRVFSKENPGVLPFEDYPDRIEELVERFPDPKPYRVIARYSKVFNYEDKNHPDIEVLATLPRGSVVKVVGRRRRCLKIVEPYEGWITETHGKKKGYSFVDPISGNVSGGIEFGVPLKEAKELPPHMKRGWWETKPKLTRKQAIQMEEDELFGKFKDRETLYHGKRGWYKRMKHNDSESDGLESPLARRKRKRTERLARNLTWPQVYPPHVAEKINQNGGVFPNEFTPRTGDNIPSEHLGRPISEVSNLFLAAATERTAPPSSQTQTECDGEMFEM